MPLTFSIISILLLLNNQPAKIKDQFGNLYCPGAEDAEAKPLPSRLRLSFSQLESLALGNFCLDANVNKIETFSRDLDSQVNFCVQFILEDGNWILSPKASCAPGIDPSAASFGN